MEPRPPSDTCLPEWTGRAILHVDLDAFFAAVEQLDHPEWRGKPVIVGGDPTRRGVVSTASYEARVFGIHSAMPSMRAASLCPDAIWAPPRFARYKELSDAVFAIFRDESPRVQPVSVDEAYLDVTPGGYSTENPIAIARRIRERVAMLGLTCSVGISASKTVSKIASEHDKPDGLTVVRPGEEAAFLAPLPVRSLPGIGPQTAVRLGALGIRTLGQLAQLDLKTAETLFGSHGADIVERAAGLDRRPVRPNDPAKSVSNERTFAEDIRDPVEVRRALDSLAAKVGSRVRKKGLAGRTVTIKVRFTDFSTRTVRRTIDTPTDDEGVFGPIAQALLKEAWSPGVGLRLLGVGLSGFESKALQLDLLDTADQDDHPAESNRLLHGIDAVKERFGEGAVTSGRELDRRLKRQKDDGNSG